MQAEDPSGGWEGEEEQAGRSGPADLSDSSWQVYLLQTRDCYFVQFRVCGAAMLYCWKERKDQFVHVIAKDLTIPSSTEMVQHTQRTQIDIVQMKR